MPATRDPRATLDPVAVLLVAPGVLEVPEVPGVPGVLVGPVVVVMMTAGSVVVG